MEIEIAQRLKPFTHRPGMPIILPGTSISVEVYPSRLKFYDIINCEPHLCLELALDVIGPVNDFTVIQNLEKAQIIVMGQTPRFYFRYTMTPTLKGVAISFEKASHEITLKIVGGEWQKTEEGLTFEGETETLFPAQSKGRLSLGSHRAQDWELLWRRKDLSAILPIWYFLGSQIPNFNSVNKENFSLQLFNRCQEVISENHPEDLYQLILTFLLAHFEGGLSPRNKDTDYQGIIDECESHVTPLIYLKKGSELIKSLFIEYSDEHIRFLPCLPPEFHCGRFINVDCGVLGNVEIEWSKKQLRRVVFHSKRTQKMRLSFSKDQKSCRLRISEKDRGFRYLNGTDLDVKEGQSYWLDNFER